MINQGSTVNLCYRLV